MKNTIYKKFAFILTIALVAIMVLPSLNAVAADSITIYVDGKKVEFPDVQPEIISGRTMIPIRHFFNAIGYKVDYTSDSAPIRIYNPTQTQILTLTLNSDIYTYNGKEGNYRLDVPAQKVGDRTLAPLRFPLQELGYEVDGSAKGVVYVTKNSGGISNENNTGGTSEGTLTYYKLGFRNTYQYAAGTQDSKVLAKVVVPQVALGGNATASAGNAVGAEKNDSYTDGASIYLGAKYSSSDVETGLNRKDGKWSVYVRGAGNLIDHDKFVIEEYTESYKNVTYEPISDKYDSSGWHSFNLYIPDNSEVQYELAEHDGFLRFRITDITNGSNTVVLRVKIPFSGLKKAGAGVLYRMVTEYYENVLNNTYKGGMKVDITAMRIYKNGSVENWSDNWGYTISDTSSYSKMLSQMSRVNKGTLGGATITVGK